MALLITRNQRSSLICPYCRSGLDHRDSVPCPRCSARLHPECLAIYTDCPVYGCSRKPRRARSRAVGATAPESFREQVRDAQLSFLISNVALGLIGWRVIPAFVQIFEEANTLVPWQTEVFVSVTSWVGGTGSLLLASASIVLWTLFATVFPRARLHIYRLGVFANVIVIPFLVVIMLFLPLITLTNKL